MKNDYPDDKERERTKEIIKLFNNEVGKELTNLYLNVMLFFLADVIWKLIKASIKEFDINPLYCISLPDYTWQCGLIYTD